MRWCWWCLILFLFLQNWKATLVPGIAIPVALVGTFLFVKVAGFSLNQLTLFGLVLATGLVVDDAITVIEDTSTKKAQGMSAIEAAKSTMNELFGAVIATSLVLFAVFLPVLFFPGATGTIYKQFAATIIFSVAISTFNALTFSPMLSALLLAREGEPPSRRTYAIAGTAIGFVYGMLVSGGGALVVLGMVVAGLLVGYLLGLITRLPLRLPVTILASGVIALVIGGVEPALARGGSSPRSACCWGLSWVRSLAASTESTRPAEAGYRRGAWLGAQPSNSDHGRPGRWHRAHGGGLHIDPLGFRADGGSGLCDRFRAGSGRRLPSRTPGRSSQQVAEILRSEKAITRPPSSAEPASKGMLPTRDCSSSVPATGTNGPIPISSWGRSWNG